METDPIIKAEMLELISAPPTIDSLKHLISWIDLRCADAEWGDSIYHQFLARAVIAQGYLYLEFNESLHTIVNTIRSAEEYALNPTKEKYTVLFDAATKSYGFGPGEGCHSIREPDTEKRCYPGSGCGSGSGCLLSFYTPPEKLMPRIYQELYPWITGTDDPVISRAGHV
jgi:hypothetical protein